MSEWFPQFGAIHDKAYQAPRIIAVARQIRARCGQARNIPFRPESCAESFRVRVSYVSLPDRISGRLVQSSSGYEIEVNSGDSRLRRRFNVSHELGHLCFINSAPVFPRERGVIAKVEEVDEREEWLCNKIASELLMPRSRFLIEASRLTPSFQNTLVLAGIFEVSPTAIFWRLRELSPWSIAQATWRLDARTAMLADCSGPKLICKKKRRGGAKVVLSSVETFLIARLREARTMLNEHESEEALARIFKGDYVVVPVLYGEVVVRRQRDGHLCAYALA